ncbi:MAG: trans-sulfuration enzyme family protein, partial [Desulfobulbia bacterium]
YGGTYRLFSKVFAKYGIKFNFIGMESVEKVAEYVNSNTKLIWIETPTNPMLNIIDIAGLAELARENDCLLAVDNTFATPYLQRPLELGADIVMHSVTKYLGGHSDVIMGALVCKDDELAEQLYFLQNSSGAISGPMDNFLVLRGLKTLHIRMQRHSENAEKIIGFLSGHEKVKQVYWPGLPDHPNHDIAKRQMDGFGGMLSFSLKSESFEEAKAIVEKVEVFSLAESLGGVESLIGHPASMTHASIPKEEREKTGVVDSLIRLSVGIEDADDLIADLELAMG